MTVKVVAELSANHRGSLAEAERLVVSASQAGAWGVKLQTWDPELMVMPKEHRLIGGPWAGRELAELYAEARTPWEWHAPIFALAKQLGLEPFSSVFDLPSLDFLEDIGCARYKIASFELVDLRLIRAVAATRKPIVISTGMASQPEIKDAVEAAKAAGARDITLLKCTSAYPASAKDMNLRTMQHMRTTTGCAVGLSDHTRGLAAAVVAAAMGASMIEKHLTNDRSAGGPDAAFSAEPDELARLVEEVNKAELAPGEIVYGPAPEERPQLELRRSLYFTRAMAPGEPIARSDLVASRPARGLPPRFFEHLQGATLARAVNRGDPVRWELVNRKPLN